MKTYSYFFGGNFLKEKEKKYHLSVALVMIFFIFGSLALGKILHRNFLELRAAENSERMSKIFRQWAAELNDAIQEESLRSPAEYSYLNTAGLSQASFQKLSSLYLPNGSSKVPGVIGFFQLDASDSITYPFLDRGTTGAKSVESLEREELAKKLNAILQNANPVGLENPIDRNLLETFLSAIKGRSLEDLNSTLASNSSNRKIDVKSLKFAGKKESKFNLDSKFESEQFESAKKSFFTRSGGQSIQFEHRYFLDSGHVLFVRRVPFGKQNLVQGFVQSIEKLKEELHALLEKEEDWREMKISFLVNSSVFDVKNGPETTSTLFADIDVFGPLKVIVWAQELTLAKSHLLILLGYALFVIFINLLVILLFWNTFKQKRLLDAQSHFVSSVNHELRTPLTAIRMHSELLLNDWIEDNEKKRRSFAFVLSESERLSRLIENVLRFSKIGRNALQIQLETANAKVILESMIKKIRDVAIIEGFEIEFKNEIREEVFFEIDRDLFYQVLINIVDNSLKYAKFSEPRKIVINLNSNSDIKSIIVSVRDYGPGIRGQDRQKVFELFFREDNEVTKQSTGTGIGLALVKELLSKMNAEISFKNLDCGVEFQIRFPQKN